jgi:hypothetical protein
MRLKAVGVVLLLLLGVTVASRPLARADDPIEIVVEATKVRPEVLRAAIDRTVVFRNRSGRPMDVSFLGYRGMHHVSETSGQLTVVFHLAGRHPYVVMFGDAYEGHLHGVVEISPDRSHERELPVCDGLKILGVCLAR